MCACPVCGIDVTVCDLCSLCQPDEGDTEQFGVRARIFSRGKPRFAEPVHRVIKAGD